MILNVPDIPKSVSYALAYMCKYLAIVSGTYALLDKR